jgi:hypothetical protein
VGPIGPVPPTVTPISRAFRGFVDIRSGACWVPGGRLVVACRGWWGGWFQGLSIGLAAEIFAPVGASTPSYLPHLQCPRGWPRAVATGTVR